MTNKTTDKYRNVRYSTVPFLATPTVGIYISVAMAGSGPARTRTVWPAMTDVKNSDLASLRDVTGTGHDVIHHCNDAHRRLHPQPPHRM